MEETIGYEALFSAEEWDELEHQVTVWFPPGEFAGNEAKHEIECDRCGPLGAHENLEQAEAVARQHEGE